MKSIQEGYLITGWINIYVPYTRTHLKTYLMPDGCYICRFKTNLLIGCLALDPSVLLRWVVCL